MSKNKAAVKRQGNSRPDNISAYIRDEVQRQSKLQYSLGALTEQDCMLIALKEMGVLGPKRIVQLDAKLREVRRRCARMAVEDADSGDDEIWYTKAKVDEAMQRAMGEKWFLPWEVRYDLRMYTDGLRSVEIRNRYDDFEKLLKETKHEDST